MKLYTRVGSLLVIGVALGVTGCGGYGSLCSDAMDCEGGNDADVDACEASFEHQEEIASIEECDDEWDDYVACIEDNADCDNDHYGTNDCDSEAENLGDCLD